ncbi:restriction endonuclease [Streptomyces fungicidicus]|uniref:restriction endonuclease n=1 Tax=Streptomyces fungicidicus TaxID=68203 RepID=UPI0033E88D75
MTDTEFEEFCFALLEELGFVNIDWRKGTGLNASPSDRGRDIVAERLIEEFDGERRLERWFIDCKHYRQGVPPDKITGLLSWAAAERADVALVVASNYLSNPCKDFIATYRGNNRPSFRIKYWERPSLRKLLEGKEVFLSRIELAKQRKRDGDSQVTFTLSPPLENNPGFRAAYSESYYHLVSARLLHFFPRGTVERQHHDIYGFDLLFSVHDLGDLEERIVYILLKPSPLHGESVRRLQEEYKDRRMVRRLVVTTGVPDEYADADVIWNSGSSVSIVKWHSSSDDENLRAAVESALEAFGAA